MDAIRKLIQRVKSPQSIALLGNIALVCVMALSIYFFVVIGAILDAVFH
jgi:hypothetical protein